MGKTWVVYPRVCGGTLRTASAWRRVTGLSPRVRGNPLAPDVAFGDARSIPACAGEPIPGNAVGTVAKVYPRVCGGTFIKPIRGRPYIGLSPRVRGNRADGFRRQAAHGSIPACAGEPVIGHFVGDKNHGLSPRVRGNHLFLGRPVKRHWVYPRVCGGTAN